MGSFGEKLRKQREQRGLELDAISNVTKISPRMLRALEEEHFDQLPGGVFNKGFVRAYARQVGLDEEEAVADYLAALRESQIQQQTILPDFRSAGNAGKAAANETVAPNLRSASADRASIPGDSRNENLADRDFHNQQMDGPDSGSNTGGDGHPPDELQTEDRRKHPDRRRSEPEVFPVQGFITGPEYVPPAGDPPSSGAWKKFAAALLFVLVLLAFWNLRRHNAAKEQPLQPPFTREQASPPPAASAPPDRLPLSSASVAEKPAAAHEPAGKPLPTNSVPPVARTKTQAPAVKPPATFTLLIRAEKTSWVSIVADGKPVAEETLIAPAHTSIRASREISVRAGNAAGISFVLNGKEIPARGSDGEVRTYVFDAAGFHTQTQAQAPTLNP